MSALYLSSDFLLIDRSSGFTRETFATDNARSRLGSLNSSQLNAAFESIGRCIVCAPCARLDLLYSVKRLVELRMQQKHEALQMFRVVKFDLHALNLSQIIKKVE